MIAPAPTRTKVGQAQGQGAGAAEPVRRGLRWYASPDTCKAPAGATRRRTTGGDHAYVTTGPIVRPSYRRFRASQELDNRELRYRGDQRLRRRSARTAPAGAAHRAGGVGPQGG